MILHLICDNSGSMIEGGKAFAMRNTVITIAQWFRMESEQTPIRLYRWAAEIQALPDWSNKDEFPVELLSGGGKCSGQSLIQMLGRSPDGKILILTDALWSLQETRVLQRWQESLPADTLRFIKIGADTHSQLKWANIFTAEELFAALDGLLERAET